MPELIHPNDMVFEPNVIYLRDHDGLVYAQIKPGGDPVRHRTTGHEYPVRAVEVATGMVQVEEVNRQGDLIRTRWHRYDEFEVVGKPPPPPSPVAARAELERIRDRQRELEQYLHEAQTDLSDTAAVAAEVTTVSDEHDEQRPRGRRNRRREA